MKLNLRRRLYIAEALYIALFNLVFLVFVALPVMNKLFHVDHSSQINEFTVTVFLLIAFPALLLYVKIHGIILERSLKRRAEALASFVASRHMRPGGFAISSTLRAIAKDDAYLENRFLAEDWGFGDYSFNVYRKYRNGRAKVRTYYYAVGAFQLPRKLPNVFFDSKHTGGREISLLLKRSQRHSLEGGFDTFFTTYFHESYTIDNLSFITPEVMEALQQAGTYDIEIYQDKLYLYNEIEDMPAQIADIEKKGKAIRSALQNNIYTYRDERIDYTDGRSTISILGLDLKRSRGRYYTGLSAGLIMVLTGLYLMDLAAFRGFDISTYLIIWGGITALNNIRKLYQIISSERYVASHQQMSA